MVQNHLLQILCVVAMETPVSLGSRDLRDRKLDVLRSVRPLTPAEVAEHTRRARYTAGRLTGSGGANGETVPSYVDEEGVDPKRGTETYAEVMLELDSWRWSGTRFLLRTGKALSRRRKEAVVRFRPVPRLPFGEDVPHPAPNELRIGLDGPHDFTLCLTGSKAGTPPSLAPLVLNADLSEPELPAYGRVLMDVLNGDSTLSIRGDEAEQAWRILTPVLEGWADGRVPMEEYRAGTDGPVARRSG